MNKNILRRLESAISAVGVNDKDYTDGRTKACECAISCHSVPNSDECVHQCYLRHMNINDGREIGLLYGECLVLNTCKCVAKCQKGYGGPGGDINQVRSCAEGCNKRFARSGAVITGDILKKCKNFLGNLWYTLTQG